jgi:hypothetical protein
VPLGAPLPPAGVCFQLGVLWLLKGIHRVRYRLASGAYARSTTTLGVAVFALMGSSALQNLCSQRRMRTRLSAHRRPRPARD